MIALNAQTGPVLSAYRANAAIDSLLAAHSAGPPIFEAQGQHAVIHSVWRVSEPDSVATLSLALNALDGLYIADGHHRSAAASRVAAERRQAGNTADASHEYFLSVAYADNQMKIFDYNRIVADLNRLSSEAFIARLAGNFMLEPSPRALKPSQAGHYAMYIDHRWYALIAKPQDAPRDPVADLDISVLSRHLLEPLLGIVDPRTDPRIGFVGGVRGLEELERRVDSGKAAVAFAIYPTSMKQLMSVADAGLLMPPKSTWFEPKLADGLLTHVLD